MSYPVTFEADYVERRNRLTAFFRLILAIPLAIWLYFYRIAALILVFIAWFAIVITGSYPQGLYDFVAGYTRSLARYTAYVTLLTDPYPSFGGSPDPAYPVRMEFAGPLDPYSRAKTFFRIILMIPVAIVRWVMELLLYSGAIGAWIVILITGKVPRGLFDLMVLASSYIARSDAYINLLTETLPPFQDDQTRAAGTPPTPPAEPATPAPPAADYPSASDPPPAP